MTRRRDAFHDQAGMSLVELVVASAVTVIILAGVSALFAQGLRAQATTVDGDTATGRTEVVAQSLEQSLRNARKATVSADGRSLAAEVLDAGAWTCRRWSLKVAGDPLKNTLEYTAKGKTTVLATGVADVAGGVFGPTSSTLDFGGRVSYHLQIAIKQTEATATGAVLLQAAGSGGGSC